MPTHTALRLALAQMVVEQGDQSANLEKIQALAADAAQKGANLLCLPELCCPGYFINPAQTRQLAQPVDGALFKVLSRCALQHQLFLTVGYAELAPDGSVYNSYMLIHRDGTLLGNTRKVYLWGKEKESFCAGTHFPVFQTPWGKLGILNCYDAEFSEPARILALKGASLILVPAAFSLAGARRWEVVLAANALFNLLYVAGINQVNPYCCGRSQVIDPEGAVRVCAGQKEETMLLCDIDLADVETVRTKIPYFKDFRPDTFSMEALTRY